VDINPDDLVGISKNQMHLLDLFLIHCFVNHSPKLTNEENEKLQKNHSDMVTSGQNNSTMIFYKNTMMKTGDALTELVNELSLLAKSLDGNDKIYSNALINVINDENKSSALVKKIDQNSSFHEVALAKSIQNTHELRQNNTLDLDYLSAERERSLKEFEEIENSPNKDIEAYVKKYNSQI
jgi:glutamate--cysteine ligase